MDARAGCGEMGGSTGGYRQNHNEISGGVFYNVVVQGGTVTLQLPPTIPAGLTGMPSPSPAFTGREADASILLNGLRPDGTATGRQVVAGLAGVGKTELVLQVADRALRTPGLLSGGVLFLDLFGYDDQRLLTKQRALDTLLRALAVPDECVPEDVQGRAALYRSILATYAAEGKRVLVVLDNARNSAQVRDLLPGDPRSPVLITSRHTLSDLDARVHELRVLDPPEAVALLGRSLRTVRGLEDTRVADDPASAERLAVLCGQLPLALRIISALLADLPARPLRSMADALEDTRRRLERLSREDLAVRSAFELSYRHLRSDQALVFRLLPASPGPDVSTESAARLCALDDFDAERVLLDLARAHLIEPGGTYGRWRMHDLVRLYAEALSRTTDSDEIRLEALSRLFSHYANNARAASTHIDGDQTAVEADHRARVAEGGSGFPDRRAALDWLDAERENLLAAARTATGLGSDGAKFQVHLAVSLMSFLSWRRHLTDLVGLLDLALAAMRSEALTVDPRQREGAVAEIMNNRAIALVELRRLDEALAAFRQAGKHLADLGHFQGAAETLINMGHVLVEQRKPELAVRVLQGALAELPDDSPPSVRGMALTNLGMALHDLGRDEEAVRAFSEDIVICRTRGDRIGEGVTLNNLGLSLSALGRIPEAIAAHTLALAAAEETEDDFARGLASSNIGFAHYQAGDHEKAVAWLEAALAVLLPTGETHWTSQTQNNLALAYREVGRFEEAIDLLRGVAETIEPDADQHNRAMALTNLGAVLERAGRLDEAITTTSAAVDLLRSLGQMRKAVEALHNLTLHLSRASRHEEALSANAELLEAAVSEGDGQLIHRARSLREALLADRDGPGSSGTS
ncbi:tetratricopeptide repeat protein [Streptomyces sp. NPDC059761]|uniref:tetratricopeptide repeat protein n=1 Tax=Streptomyces sp. NPDC059761 TaxID=3346937 RepID=UPI0036566932